MGKQGTLFNPYSHELVSPPDPPSQRHSLTSGQAAKEIKPHVTKLQARVLGFIRDHPRGVTDEQIADGLEMNPSTVRPRRGELLAKKLIKQNGTGKTKSGRSAALWVSLGATSKFNAG
jgi:DNA-binding NarL/FixJ family response regulator